MVGCSGDPVNQAAETMVARAMASQANGVIARGKGAAVPAEPSFFYHLGDIVYRPDEPPDDPSSPELDPPAGPVEQFTLAELYQKQYYVPYSRYRKPIFSLAGNHDGKVHLDGSSGLVAPEKSPVYHFQKAFGVDGLCIGRKAALNGRLLKRTTVSQPGLFWTLETPLVSIVGLYTNVINGGQLDSPDDSYAPQLHWLIAELERLGSESRRRPIVIASHYPPFSGAPNFKERGDPNQSKTPRFSDRHLEPLAALLRRAYDLSGIRPDLVVSAHAHHYQRITYRFADGYEIPHIIAGCGGHGPIESMAHFCDGTYGAPSTTPFAAVLPGSLTLPTGDSATVVAYNDTEFGFMRFTVDSTAVRGNFFAIPSSLALSVKKGAQKAAVRDSFLVSVTATPGAHRVSQGDPALR